MGNPKQKWTSDEEEALRAGVAKHGPGKWKLIQKDPEFNQFLHSRSNIDLKDKWRNMSAAVQGGSREKLRIPKPKDPIALAIIPPPQTQTQPPSQTMLLTQSQSHAVSVVPVPISIHDSTADHVTVKDDAVKDLPDGKIAPRYNEMIFEALSDLKQQSGLDIVSIVAYIEQRIEVPHNFRKQLGARLRRLVQQDKLEKVDSLYRLKNNTMETHTSNRKDNWPRQNLTTFYSKVGESLEEAAKTAAFKVVEAETKSYMAAEAVKEAEKFSKLAEETDSIFQFAKEIFDRCARGELVVVA